MAQSRSKAALALMILGFSLIAAIPAFPVAEASTGAPTSLALTVVPPMIPADGGDYSVIYVSLVDSSGSPTVSLSNVTVFLTSSTPAVGVVLNSSLILGEGRSFAVASFQSTPTVGTTQITASASGLGAASTTVTTAVLRGYPASISITPVPSEVNSTSTSTRAGTLIVEFQDKVGQPAKAATDTVVSVYSSSPQILALNATSFVMKAGQLLKVLSFITGFVPGSATVTASASQLASGTAQVTVLGRPPLGLKLFSQPDGLVTSGSGRLVIALTDLNGKPTRAPSNVAVQLRSSNSSVVSVPLTATITAGTIYTTVTMSASAKVGPVTITASSSGLRSGFVTINTYSPGGQPYQLRLFIGPNPILADHGNYSSVVVALYDRTGAPTVSNTTPYNVILTSSQNSSVGDFGPSSITSMTIPQGSNNVVWPTMFTSTFVAGNTSLTASAQDLLPAQGALSTFGPVPSRIAISSLFPAVTADGGSHPALQVSLEDSFGAPAVAPTPVTVYLSSSQSGIATVYSPVTINPGQSAAVVSVTTTSVSGTANITAYTTSLSRGYAASSTDIQTVTPSPSAIGAYAEPTTLNPSPLQGNGSLILQLQDRTGDPAKARVPTTLTITSSNALVFNRTLTVQIPQGASFVSVPIVPLAPGQTTFTVTSPGLSTATVSFRVLPPSFSLTLTASSLVILSNESATLTVNAAIDGAGVSGAKVTWSATGGLLVSASATTNSQGAATAILRPSALGVATVTAVVSALGAPSQTLTSEIIVKAPARGSGGLLGTLLSFPYVFVLIGAVAAVVVVVAFLFIRRRRAAEAEGAISEDEGAFSIFRPAIRLGSGVLG